MDSKEAPVYGEDKAKDGKSVSMVPILQSAPSLPTEKTYTDTAHQTIS
jgi:hypothetical protein